METLALSFCTKEVPQMKPTKKMRKEKKKLKMYEKTFRKLCACIMGQMNNNYYKGMPKCKKGETIITVNIDKEEFYDES